MPDEINLGLMPPLTGLVSLYGEEISRAALIAEREINESGGILGRRLKIIIEDDGSLPSTAVPAAEKLVLEKNCVAIIGNLLSNSRIAVANRVNEKLKVPFLNFSFYEGSIFNPYFFNFAALPNQQIYKMIPYMAQKYGPKFFFAGSNYEWPLGSIDAAKLALHNYGGEIVGEEYLPIGSENIDGLLEKVKKSGADVFVPYFAGIDQVNLLTSFTRMGLKERMAVVMGHYDEAMVSNLSPEIREGFYSSNTYFMSVDTIENCEVLERIQKFEGVTGLWPRGNGILTNFGEGTYACVKAFARAATVAESLEPEALCKALAIVKIRSPQGDVWMDPMTQHARVNSFLAKCDKDGWFSIVEDFGSIEPVIPKRYLNRIIYGQKTPNAPKEPVAYSLNLETQDQSPSDRILAKTDIAIIVTDENGIIVYVNESTCELFLYQKQELIGKSVGLILPPRFREAHEIHMRGFLNSPDQDRRMGKRGEIAGYTKKGEEFPAEATITKIKIGDNNLMVASLRDITDKKKMEENLTWKAGHDPLTQLPNRSLINERISNALARATRTQEEIAILFVDLDGFKVINDSYGHEFGDKLLMEVSERLVSTVRPGDTVARFGGDEFIILCEQIKERETAFGIANRLSAFLRKPFEILDKTIFISGSIGISFGEGGLHSAPELIKNADIAMYEAKVKGRDNWRIFSKELQETITSEMTIANGLRSAIEKNELIPYFQPIFNIDGTQILGAELLARWVHGDNFISPSLFIPIAEKSGAILEIGYWAFQQGAQMQQKISALASQGEIKQATPYISINFSTKLLDDEHLFSKMKTIIDNTGVDVSKLLIEITESRLMSNAEKNISTLVGMKNIGLHIAVDDFGTGYSSLNYLTKMPITNIKIDKSFIDNLVDSPEQKTVVSAIIMMAHAMKMGIIAEGVETNAQLEILKVLECTHIQGYLFARPMKSDDFLEFLKAKNNPEKTVQR